MLKRYEKLTKKQKSLEKVTKPEPEVINTTNNRPLEAKDAKKVIENLKKCGQLPMIQANKKSEFKRKLPANVVTKKQQKAELEDSREIVRYDDDDLFS